MYNSTDVAKYIVSRASRDGIQLNMTKLQKLLYAAYGIYLQVKNERLTYEEPKAWPYGPVFPNTRTALLKLNFDLPVNFEEEDAVKTISENNEIVSLIDMVFKTFGNWTAGQLTEWSHAKYSPWEKTKCSVGFDWGQVIPDEYIKEYFSKIVVKNE